jgi:hypothetical protein
MRVGRINGESYCVQDILHKAKGDHLDRVQSYQKVLWVIRQGKLVLVIRGQESQN